MWSPCTELLCALTVYHLFFCERSDRLNKKRNGDFTLDGTDFAFRKRKFPKETLAIFIKPPSIDELKIRLKKRQTESEDKIKMRVSKASAELATAPLFDVIVVNKELGKAQKKAFDLIADFIKK